MHIQAGLVLTILKWKDPLYDSFGACCQHYWLPSGAGCLSLFCLTFWPEERCMLASFTLPMTMPCSVKSSWFYSSCSWLKWLYVCFANLKRLHIGEVLMFVLLGVLK